MSSPLIELYDEFADDYERTRVPRFRPLVKRLLQLYDTRPGSNVLDAGCGTGLAATMVAPRVGHTGHVLGVDASSGMLEIARRKAQGYGFDQCKFVLGDISRLDVPEAAFDVVLCSFAVWGEPNILFSEFHRVLKPRGALLLQNWQRSTVTGAPKYAEVLSAFAERATDTRVVELETIFAKQRAALQNLQSPEDYERVLRAAGFSVVAASSFEHAARFNTLDEFIEFQDISVFSRAQIAAMDPPTRAEFHSTVRDALAPFVIDSGIAEPWQVIQLAARK